jgi:hypothetical protein
MGLLRGMDRNRGRVGSILDGDTRAGLDGEDTTAATGTDESSIVTVIRRAESVV